MREIDFQAQIDATVAFIRRQVQDAGMQNLVVGLSGGIDSAVTAALCVQAVGAKHVSGLMLPYRLSHPDSLNHATILAETLGIQTHVIDISPMVDAYFETYEPEADSLRRGNRMARERMCVLYDYSAKYNALVAGTGNRSELLIGYCTQYGDSACAFEPIGHLYKTEVKEIARILGVPEAIIEKHPTADLWEGQTDEDEMGITYVRLDAILHQLYDRNRTLEEILALGFSSEEIGLVQRMYTRSSFKREMPPQPEGIV
jgi:NAD+ synthase